VEIVIKGKKSEAKIPKDLLDLNTKTSPSDDLDLDQRWIVHRTLYRLSKSPPSVDRRKMLRSKKKKRVSSRASTDDSPIRAK